MNCDENGNGGGKYHRQALLAPVQALPAKENVRGSQNFDISSSSATQVPAILSN